MGDGYLLVLDPAADGGAAAGVRCLSPPWVYIHIPQGGCKPRTQFGANLGWCPLLAPPSARDNCRGSYAAVALLGPDRHEPTGGDVDVFEFGLGPGPPLRCGGLVHVPQRLYLLRAVGHGGRRGGLLLWGDLPISNSPFQLGGGDIWRTPPTWSETSRELHIYVSIYVGRPRGGYSADSRPQRPGRRDGVRTYLAGARLDYAICALLECGRTDEHCCWGMVPDLPGSAT